MKPFAGIENNTYFCGYHLNKQIMPEIFRAFGFSFLFFSHEHDPIHVHVIGKYGNAKYIWDGKEFVFYEQYNIKANDLKKIKMMIDENSDLIIKYWNRYFGKEAKDED